MGASATAGAIEVAGISGGAFSGSRTILVHLNFLREIRFPLFIA